MISLYVRDSARSTAEEAFNRNIKAALAIFKSELLDSLDTTYVRKAECDLMSGSQGDRQDIVDVRLTNIESRINAFNAHRGKQTS